MSPYYVEERIQSIKTKLINQINESALDIIKDLSADINKFTSEVLASENISDYDIRSNTTWLISNSHTIDKIRLEAEELIKQVDDANTLWDVIQFLDKNVDKSPLLSVYGSDEYVLSLLCNYGYEG